MTDKERYHWMVENNYCVDCGKKKGNDKHVRCKECRDWVAKKGKAKRDEKKKNHICIHCGRPAEDGRTRCVECRKHAKDLYDYRKENHLCVSCGEKVDDNSAYCLRCKQIASVKTRERYANMTPEQKYKRSQYRKEYMEKHPEKAAIYRARENERAKQRYRERKMGYEW